MIMQFGHKLFRPKRENVISSGCLDLMQEVAERMVGNITISRSTLAIITL